MSKISSIHLYAERPAQRRMFETQAAELGLDPTNQSSPESHLGYALLSLILDPLEYGPPGYINLFLPHGAVETAEDMPPISIIQYGVINIAAGCWVYKFRPDYLLHVKAPASSIVAVAALECDGHRFHNDTPEQVSKDRARDRAFQDRGMAILRYTANDVLDDPHHCARDAIQILLRQSASRPRK